MMDMPASIEDQKLLDKKLEAAVALKKETKLLAEDITAIALDVKEKFGIPKVDFNALIKVRLLEQTDPDKYEEQKKLSDVLFEINEALGKKG